MTFWLVWSVVCMREREVGGERVMLVSSACGVVRVWTKGVTKVIIILTAGMLKHRLHSKLNEGNVSVLGDGWELVKWICKKPDTSVNTKWQITVSLRGSTVVHALCAAECHCRVCEDVLLGNDIRVGSQLMQLKTDLPGALFSLSPFLLPSWFSIANFFLFTLI